MQQRLQKLLAAAGIASRRSCEALIAEGRVTVNGARVTEPGAKADPDTDDVRLDGKPIAKSIAPIYLALNKPTGFVTTVKDPHAKHTVMELLHGITERVYPVGRLDADSAGLLLLTNDGSFTERLTHPRHQVNKTYRAVVRGEVPDWATADLRKGVMLDDGMTAPAQVEWVDYQPEHNITIVDITIHEGRNRQVRRMFDAIGYPVLALTRTRIGPIQLKGLAPGSWRKLHPREVKALLDEADSTPPSLPQKPVEEPVEEDPRSPVRAPRAHPKAPQRVASPRSQRPGASVQRPPRAAPVPRNAAPARPPADDKQAAIRAAAEELNAKLRADRSPEDDQPRGKTERRKTDASPRQAKRQQNASERGKGEPRPEPKPEPKPDPKREQKRSGSGKPPERPAC